MNILKKLDRRHNLKFAMILSIIGGFAVLIFSIGSPNKRISVELPLGIMSDSDNTFHALSCINYSGDKQSVEFKILNHPKIKTTRFEILADSEKFVDLKSYGGKPYSYIGFSKFSKSIDCTIHTFLIDANNQANYFYSTSIVPPLSVSENTVPKNPQGNILTLVTNNSASLDISFNNQIEKRFSTSESDTLAIEELPITFEKYKITSVDSKIKHYAFHRWLLDTNSSTWSKIEKLVNEFNLSEKKEIYLSSTNLKDQSVIKNNENKNNINRADNKTSVSKSNNSGIVFVNNPTTREGKHTFYVQNELGDSPNYTGQINYQTERYSFKIPFQAVDSKNPGNKGKLTCRFLDSNDNNSIKTYIGAQIKKLENTGILDSWEVVWSPTSIGESGPLGIRIQNPQGDYLDYVFSYVVKSGFPSADTQKAPEIIFPNTIFIGQNEIAVGVGKIVDPNKQDYQTLSLSASVISEPKSDDNTQQINHEPKANVELIAGEDGYGRYFYLQFYNSYDYPLNSGIYNIRLVARDFMGFKTEKIVTVNVDQRWNNAKTKPTLVLPNNLTRIIGVYTLYQLVTTPKFVTVKGWGDTFPGFDSIPGRPAIPGSNLDQQAGVPLLLLARGLKKYPNRSEKVKISVGNDAGKSEGIVNIDAKDLSINLPPAIQTFEYNGPNKINPGSKVEWTVTLFDPNQLSQSKNGNVSNQPQAPIFFNNRYGASISKKSNKENTYTINWVAPKALGNYVFSIRTGDAQGGITNYKFSATVTDEIDKPKPEPTNPSCMPIKNTYGISNKINLNLDEGPKELKKFYLRARDPLSKYPLKVNLYLINRAESCTKGKRLALPTGFNYQYDKNRKDVYISWIPTDAQASDPKQEYRLCTELENKSKTKGYCYHVIEVFKKNTSTTSGTTAGNTTDSTQSGSSTTGSNSGSTDDTTSSSTTGSNVGTTTGETTSNTAETTGTTTGASTGTTGSTTSTTENVTTSGNATTGNVSTGSNTGNTGNTGTSNTGVNTGETNTGSQTSTSTTGVVTGGSTGTTLGSTTGIVTGGSTGSTGSTTGNTGTNSSGTSGANSTGTSSTGNTNPTPTISISPSPNPSPSAKPSPNVSPFSSPSPIPDPSATSSQFLPM